MDSETSPTAFPQVSSVVLLWSRRRVSGQPLEPLCWEECGECGRRREETLERFWDMGRRAEAGPELMCEAFPTGSSHP